MMVGANEDAECQLFLKALNNRCIGRSRLRTSDTTNMRRWSISLLSLVDDSDAAAVMRRAASISTSCAEAWSIISKPNSKTW